MFYIPTDFEVDTGPLLTNGCSQLLLRGKNDSLYLVSTLGYFTLCKGLISTNIQGLIIKGIPGPLTVESEGL